MAHPNILDGSKSALLVVDVQEAFRNVIDNFDELVSRIVVAVRGFQILDRQVFVTEQYPKGLGRTADEIRDVLSPEFHYIEKTAFSSCGAAMLEDQLRTAGASQVVVCGLETHICVNQTTHDLLHRGFAVHILTDSVVSRSKRNRRAGLQKMFASGAIPSSVEMALFEMMRDASHERFKEIQRLVK
ncbi:MAG TPA: isochorismatase family protein [Pyrinomonadaceae bacterium]|nr:isochorismatase family protein [Pyrinomonadaceae bacterium]